jgi:drug/metabolite transporter superfamily protein YnfA
MKSIFLPLIIAAALEVGGDAAIRRGLVQSGWPHVALGAVMLVAYGLIVNLNRSVDFGRLMGLYIAMFFVVSQVVSVALFAGRPSASLIAGGVLIVAGGLVIQMGMR